MKVFDCTDVGNAERLAQHFGDKFRHVPEWDKYLVWTGARWEVDIGEVTMTQFAEAAIEQIRQEIKTCPLKRKNNLRAWRTRSRSEARLKAMISLARARPGIKVNYLDLDKDKWLFNCKSGTINLKTGKLQAHNPENLITKISPMKYRPGDNRDRFDKFLEEILPDKDVREYLQSFIGYAMTGDVSERKFVLLHGGGRNGKSVLLRLLRDVMGPYCGTMAPGLLMARESEAHPAEVADLFGLRLAIASEVRQGRAWDEEQVKRMSGNDELKARKMRQDWWPFKPTHKLMVALNDMPRVKDVTQSFWDRVVLIPFTTRITDAQDDKHLGDKLLKEGSGILDWMVEGCLKWQKEGLKKPDEVAAATDEYQEREDIIGRFIQEKLQFGTGSVLVEIKGGHKERADFETSIEDLNRSIRSWCERNNYRSFSDRLIGGRLSGLGAQRSRWVGEQKGRGWRGFRLIKPNEIVKKTPLTEVPDTDSSPLSPNRVGRSGHRGLSLVPSTMSKKSNQKSSRGEAVRTVSDGASHRTKEKSSKKEKALVRPPRGTRPRGGSRKQPA